MSFLESSLFLVQIFKTTLYPDFASIEWSRETLLENWIKEPVGCCERAGVHPPTSALQFASMDGEVVTPETVTMEYQEESLNSPVRLTTVEDETMVKMCFLLHKQLLHYLNSQIK